jgi:hypothetical protein
LFTKAVGDFDSSHPGHREVDEGYLRLALADGSQGICTAVDDGDILPECLQQCAKHIGDVVLIVDTSTRAVAGATPAVSRIARWPAGS